MCIMFVCIISIKPLRDFTRPTRDAQGFKRLVAYAKCNRVSHERGGRVVIIYFQFCIVKELAICKFWGVISVECYTFKLLNSYMLISQFYYSMMFCIFFVFFPYFVGFGRKALNSIKFQAQKRCWRKAEEFGQSHIYIWLEPSLGQSHICIWLEPSLGQSHICIWLEP